MPEELEDNAEELVAGPEVSFEQLDQMAPVTVPYYFPVAYDVAINSNEITIVCNKSVMIVDKGKLASYSRMDPSCVLKLSPGAAKDLTQYLYNAVKQFEERYGKIVTDAMLKHQEKKK